VAPAEGGGIMDDAKEHGEPEDDVAAVLRELLLFSPVMVPIDC
jgi:hypothetical protein